MKRFLLNLLRSFVCKLLADHLLNLPHIGGALEAQFKILLVAVVRLIIDCVLKLDIFDLFLFA